jgi:raffinose/stachyose/melibiose transport system permease protein
MAGGATAAAPRQAGGERRAAGSRRRGGRRGNQGAWLYVLPALAVFAIFIAYPIAANVIASLLKPHGGASLANYRQAATDAVFWTALRNSAIWVVLCVLCEIAIGFVLALAIEMHIPRGRVLFRTLLFLPMVITPSVIALVFTTIYAPDYGLLFGLFNSVGLGEYFPAILGDPATATVGVIAVNVWQWCGFFVLMYCVGLTRIDRELLAAAAIDGAVGFARVRYVIWPLLASTTSSLAVLGTLQALQQFPPIVQMPEGGPANATQTLATYIFQTAFVLDEMHYASAVAVILFLLSLVLIVLQHRIGRAARLANA